MLEALIRVSREYSGRIANRAWEIRGVLAEWADDPVSTLCSCHWASFSGIEGYLNNNSWSTAAQSPVSVGFKLRLLTMQMSPAPAMTPGGLFKEITCLVLEILFSNFAFNPDPLQKLLCSLSMVICSPRGQHVKQVGYCGLDSQRVWHLSVCEMRTWNRVLGSWFYRLCFGRPWCSVWGSNCLKGTTVILMCTNYVWKLLVQRVSKVAFNLSSQPFCLLPWLHL